MLKKSIQEQELINLLKLHYGLEIQSTQHLDLGADMNALTFKANTKSQSYFVKIKYGNHDEIHISIINLLHELGLKEIIFPITTVDGILFKQLSGFKIIVYPFIEGQNGFENQLTRNQWIELGQTLKKIHTLSVPSSLQKQLRKETLSPKWRNIVSSLVPQIVPNSADDKITTDFKDFFKANLGAIHQLMHSAEQLSKNITLEPKEYVLCHADIHGGNILVAKNNTIYIVDWDDPMMAPKERDLMFIGGGVGNVWNDPTEVAYFYEGYGKPHINKTILSYYRNERIIEDIALYGIDILSPHCDYQTKVISLKHFKSMFESNGVIAIALNNF